MSLQQEPTFKVQTVDFNDSKGQIKTVRHAVFVVEQLVDESLEWDGSDASYNHVLAISAEGHAIGTGRISTDGKIGRMAVLKNWRGQNVGRAILEKLIEMAIAQNLTRLELSSQLHAISFYRKLGFREHGDIYLDANIQHRAMTLYLGGQNSAKS